MAELVIEAPADAVGFFVQQHEQIRSLFTVALSRCGAERSKAFFEMRRLLAVHEAAEAAIVHPRAERVLGTDYLQLRRDERQHTETMIAALESLDVDTDEFVNILNETRKLLCDTTAREEHDELAQLRDEPMADERDRLARLALIADSIEPGRWRTSLEPQLTHFLVGSFAAMARRADEILNRSDG